MVIDKSYFIGPLAIANLSQPAVSENLETYIQLHGEQFLSKVLGETLKVEYLDGIAAESDGDIEARWITLRDGLTFTDTDNSKRVWVGFDSEETIPINPVAAYVWFHYQRDLMTQMAGIGSVSAQAENAISVSPAMRMSTVWNQMCRDVRILWRYLLVNEALVYPEWVRTEINGIEFSYINGFGI